MEGDGAELRHDLGSTTAAHGLLQAGRGQRHNDAALAASPKNGVDKYPGTVKTPVKPPVHPPLEYRVESSGWTGVIEEAR